LISIHLSSERLAIRCAGFCIAQSVAGTGHAFENLNPAPGERLSIVTAQAEADRLARILPAARSHIARNRTGRPN